jgi:crotonobetainyl-CoA:carnitine CoA-transferase CaiB-like acyl-CoA transferase
MTEQALAGLRVLDFSNVRTGAQVGQTLADLGAEVILIERPGGTALRGEAAWPFWARGKQSIALDLKSAEDLAVAHGLATSADVVIESFHPGVADRLGIGFDTLGALNPRLIYGSITGFGRDNAFSDLAGYDGVVAAKFGVNWTLEGMANRPGPAFCTVAYSSYAASQLLLQGVLAALYEREDSGLGQRVETSLAEALTVYDTFGWAARTAAMKFGGDVKQLPRVLDSVPTGGLSFRLLIALTRDGYWLQFSQTTDRLFRAMMRLFGLEWMFDDPEWKDIPNFDALSRRVVFWDKLLAIVRSKTAAQWAAEFDREPDVWGEMFRNGSELLRHPQMEWNKMVIEPRHEGIGTIRQPGPIAHLSRTPARVLAPPPALGEHAAPIRAAAASGAPWSATAAGAPSGLPLAGITIVELSTFYAAPYGVTLLGELGARVIKLEELNGEPQRKMLPFPEVAGLKALLGKESVAVDLATAEGRAIAYRIIGKADMVLQSFRGGAAKRLGLDPETLRGINPDLIYQSAPGYGIDGPYARRPAFAPTIGAAAGIAWRNAGPVIPTGADLDLATIKPASMQLGTAVMGVGNSDGMSAATVATSMMLGLLARRRGHGGQDLFTSMLSSTAHALSEVMIEYDGQPATAEADAGLYGMHALYRLYETAEEWVFLAAPRERDWTRLVRACHETMALAIDPRFATMDDRRTNDAALVQVLSAMLKTRKAAEWETLLRAQGVTCVAATRGPVEANYMDEGRGGQTLGLITTGHHPILGDMTRLKPLIRFSRSATTTGDAPLVGQDTERVLREFGYTDAEIATLRDKGVIQLG